MATCRTELRRQGAEVLSSYPSLRHEWREEQDRLVLRFPAQDADGFDVALAAIDDDIELRAGRFHRHFEDNPDPEDFIRHALGLVRDLLGPGMRLRELVAGGKPYRWFVESRTNAGWRAEEETGLLFWNVFGRRAERIFTNRHLPERL